LKLFPFFLSAVVSAILASANFADAAAGATLSADSMNYDPVTKSVTAEGNVHYASPDGELFGDRGVGYTDGRTFELIGGVRGSFATRSMDISCEYMEMETAGGSLRRRKITATGDVRLARPDGKVFAQKLMWELDRDNYRAEGGVVIDFGSYFVDSDDAARNGEQFWAHNIRRYEDRVRRLSMSASKASGIISGNGIAELVAEGALVMEIEDLKGAKTRITGASGVFSQDRGTIVVSGGASAVQDGRSLNAGSIVYHLVSGRVEALGDRPTITFELRN
jgi:lipopolysaccharide assembly outer membrane protein LptD (OstA)